MAVFTSLAAPSSVDPSVGSLGINSFWAFPAPSGLGFVLVGGSPTSFTAQFLGPTPAFASVNLRVTYSGSVTTALNGAGVYVPTGGTVTTISLAALVPGTSTYTVIATSTGGAFAVANWLGGPGSSAFNALADTWYAGADTVSGTSGDDWLLGYAGDDTLHGNAGNDALFGGDDGDSLSGDDGDDLVSGGAGNDTLRGEAGIDTLLGDEGDDWLDGGFGGGQLHGGPGNDLVSFRTYTADLRVDLGFNGVTHTNGKATGWNGSEAQGLFGIENALGGTGNDMLTGDGGANSLLGEGGDDTLWGRDGDDVLDGGPGTDLLNGEVGNDSLIGGAGDDSLSGGVGDDVLRGGEGTDTLNGGTGRDRADFSDQAAGFSAAIGPSTTYSAGKVTGGAGETGDTLLDMEDLVGGRFDDSLAGTDGANSIWGGGGADVIAGLGGDDWLSGDAGTDTLVGGLGDDWLSSGGAPAGEADILNGAQGVDTIDFSWADSVAPAGYVIAIGGVTVSFGGPPVVLANVAWDRGVVLSPGMTSFPFSAAFVDIENAVGTAGNDLIAGDDGPNGLRGRAGDDMLDGRGGDDVLDGGTGADTADGGAGNDTFFVDGSLDSAFDSGGGLDTVWSSAASFTLGAGIEFGRLFGAGAALTGGADTAHLVANQGALSTLNGGTGSETLWGGGDFAHTLNGGGGDDILRGLDSPAVMNGATGNDNFVIGHALATVTEAAGPAGGFDVAWVAVNGWTSGANVEIIYLAAPGAVRVWGSDTAEQIVANQAEGSVLAGMGGDDVLWGSPFRDTLGGGEGDDILRGQGGADVMVGGSGNDNYVVFDAGTIIVEGGSTADPFNPANGLDQAWVNASGWTMATGLEVARLVGTATVLTGSGDGENLVGNPTLGSTLDGRGGNDILWGSGFADSFTGGTGADIFYSYGGADVFRFDAPGWGDDQVSGWAAGAKLRFTAASGVTGMGGVTLTAADGNTLVSAAGGTVLVYGATLTAGDLLFG